MGVKNIGLFNLSPGSEEGFYLAAELKELPSVVQQDPELKPNEKLYSFGQVYYLLDKVTLAVIPEEQYHIESSFMSSFYSRQIRVLLVDKQSSQVQAFEISPPSEESHDLVNILGFEIHNTVRELKLVNENRNESIDWTPSQVNFVLPLAMDYISGNSERESLLVAREDGQVQLYSHSILGFGELPGVFAFREVPTISSKPSNIESSKNYILITHRAAYLLKRNGDNIVIQQIYFQRPLPTEAKLENAILLKDNFIVVCFADGSVGFVKNEDLDFSSNEVAFSEYYFADKEVNHLLSGYKFLNYKVTAKGLKLVYRDNSMLMALGQGLLVRDLTFAKGRVISDELTYQDSCDSVLNPNKELINELYKLFDEG
ncbi:MAG: hypothetical protein KDD40_06425 [Bdellovibrionales bacterium]|nr:hypothetical protein [Bdellovibrionales bacterium]